MLQTCILAAIVGVVLGQNALPSAKLRLLSPKGMELIVCGSDLEMVGFHYNVNQQVTGANAAQFNYDERHKRSDGCYHHVDTNINVHPGDTVYYWLFYQIHGQGQVKTDMSWIATADQSTGESQHTGSGSQQTGGGSQHIGGGSQQTGGGSQHTGGGSHSQHPSGTTHSGASHNGLQLIFEDNFDNGFDTSKWSNEISAFGGGNWEFQIYSPEPANTFVRNGVLYLKPTLTADKFGENFLHHGILDVSREWGTCTKTEFYGCLRNSKDAMIPPIMSSKVISKVSFRYGRVEVEAKMPVGDWTWPAIWLMPMDEVYGGWPRSGEIDMVETRGNRNYGQIGIQHMMSTLHWGPAWNQDKWGMTTQGKDIGSGTWGDDFHLYSMDWDENGIILSVDNQPVLTQNTPSSGWWKYGGFNGNNIWTNSNAAPFDQEFYFQMNVAVGGTNGFFPDNVQNGGYQKPWSNSDPKAPEKFWEAKDSWLSTWHGDGPALKVRAVRIYKKT